MIKSLNLQADYDLNKDGDVSEQEVSKTRDMSDIELREEKSETQKRMAWLSLVGIIAVTIALLTPFIPVVRVEALGSLLGMYYLSLASIIGFYFGVTAYMNK